MNIKEYIQKLETLDKEVSDKLPEWVKELKTIWEEANANP